MNSLNDHTAVFQNFRVAFIMFRSNSNNIPVFQRYTQIFFDFWFYVNMALGFKGNF